MYHGTLLSSIKRRKFWHVLQHGHYEDMMLSEISRSQKRQIQHDSTYMSCLK